MWRAEQPPEESGTWGPEVNVYCGFRGRLLKRYEHPFPDKGSGSREGSNDQR